jgi:hypothetical protein
MRHLLLAASTGLFAATASPALAASMVSFSYTGTVSSDVSFSHINPPPTFPLVFGPNLAGKSVSISENFNLGNADVVSNGSFIGTLGGSNNFASAEITIGNVSASLQGNLGMFTPALGGFSSEIGRKFGFDGQVLVPGGLPGGFAFLDYSSTFTKNGVVVDASLTVREESFVSGRTLDFTVTSETFAVSPVPLPPALPMFAAALLALGIVGYARRAKDVRPAHGQAY